MSGPWGFRRRNRCCSMGCFHGVEFGGGLRRFGSVASSKRTLGTGEPGEEASLGF
jgi:hypothetical protein